MRLSGLDPLYKKNGDSASMRNVNGMSPWLIFLIRKGIMKLKHFASIHSSEE